MRLGVVTVVRDEEAIIAEWIAHYAFHGFDRIIVYDNGSTDLTRDIVRRAGKEVGAELLKWEATDPDYQCGAYRDALKRLGNDVDWVGFFDADEFLAAADGWTIRAAIQSVGDAAAIAVNWALYGSSGREESAAGLVTESYLMRAFEDYSANRHVKTLVRPQAFLRFAGCHMVEVEGSYVDPVGRATEWLQTGVTTSVRGWQRLRLNHYFTRSRADWNRKISRGYRDIVRSYNVFDEYDQNKIYDPILEQHSPDLRLLYGFLPDSRVEVARRSIERLPFGFTAEEYKELNPDVAAANWHAEAHWLTFGCAEGRAYRYPDSEREQAERRRLMQITEIPRANG